MKDKPRSLTKGELNHLVNIGSKDIPEAIVVGGVRKKWTGSGWKPDGKPQGNEVTVTG